MDKPKGEPSYVTCFQEGHREKQVKVAVPSSWRTFVHHVGAALLLEEVESIHDLDGMPVCRLASLIPGGLYFVRPTEDCAFLRVLTNVPGKYPAYDIVATIARNKEELHKAAEEFAEEVPRTAQRASKRNTWEAPAIAVRKLMVKAGRKCGVYSNPDLVGAVEHTLVAGTVVVLNDAPGDVPEHAGLREGKIVQLQAPVEGFCEAFRLGHVVGEAAEPAEKSLEERLESVREATGVAELLTSFLASGEYFRGAAVHEAAMRKLASVILKSEDARRELTSEDVAGLALVISVAKRFAEDTRLCTYTCWVLSALASESAERKSYIRQHGGPNLCMTFLKTHVDDRLLHRHCYSSLFLMMEENEECRRAVLELNAHTLALQDMKRWQEDVELHHLCCWMLYEVGCVMEESDPGLRDLIHMGEFVKTRHHQNEDVVIAAERLMKLCCSYPNLGCKSAVAALLRVGEAEGAL